MYEFVCVTLLTKRIKYLLRVVRGERGRGGCERKNSKRNDKHKNYDPNRTKTLTLHNQVYIENDSEIKSYVRKSKL